MRRRASESYGCGVPARLGLRPAPRAPPEDLPPRDAAGPCVRRAPLAVDAAPEIKLGVVEQVLKVFVGRAGLPALGFAQAWQGPRNLPSRWAGARHPTEKRIDRGHGHFDTYLMAAMRECAETPGAIRWDMSLLGKSHTPINHPRTHQPTHQTTHSLTHTDSLTG